ncbi:MAG: 50S ribosomal protein L5 [Candidatus Parcubacteria bacterium]|nr:MAG: 50S ribosomal protein L5 [Candidatus Parcubacteria bacterium]
MSKQDLKKPRPIKGIVQIGIGKLVVAHPEAQEKIIEDGIYVLSMITGQKPKIVTAKKSISGFKVRKGMPVALLVTLRKKRLNDFIQRLLTYALPRAKDFYGLKADNFDNRGNINLGFREISVFPEAISDKIKYNFGFSINLVGSGKTKEENIDLWRELGFPIKV